MLPFVFSLLVSYTHFYSRVFLGFVITVMATARKFTTEHGERDLLEAVRKSLADVGALGHFKAELRSSVMRILGQNSNHDVSLEVPEETQVLNELIREYLTWNGYIYSEQVLCIESGQSEDPVRRPNLACKLGVLDDKKTQKIPLLYYILSSFKGQD